MDGVSHHSVIPECVPARVLNEFAYCQRLAYIEWVQSDFADNFETVDGRFTHRSVDQESGKLPQALDSEEEYEARSVWMSAPNEHLTARIDLLRGHGNSATVVDYKRGQVPDNSERSWDSDRVQLCAQALILRSNGYDCAEGMLYYADSKTSVAVIFTEDLVQRTRGLVQQLRDVAQGGRIPPPLDYSSKCEGCSVAGICMPDEINLIDSRNEGTAGEEGIRRILPARDSALPLYVQEQGASIVKR